MITNKYHSDSSSVAPSLPVQVCTPSSKQIYHVSIESDFLVGEVSNHLGLSPHSLSMFFAVHPWVSSSCYLIWHVSVDFIKQWTALTCVQLVSKSKCSEPYSKRFCVTSTCVASLMALINTAQSRPYKGHCNRKWFASSHLWPHEHAGESFTGKRLRWKLSLLHFIQSGACITFSTRFP